MEKCANCERDIGNLERSFTWKESTVCLECYDALRRPAGVPAIVAQPAAVAPSAGVQPDPGEVICSNPNCGFVGEPGKRMRGNPAILIILFFFGILPGLLYAMFGYGPEYFCQRCNARLNAPARAPRRQPATA